MLKPIDRAEEQAAIAAIPAPKFVQKTGSFLFLYVALLFVNALVFAFLTHHWVLIWVGFSQAIFGFFLMGNLFQLKPWAWWAVTLGGVLIGLRDTVGLLADAARLVKHVPFPFPQFIAIHILGVLLVWPIVARMLMRPSRVAFGLSKAAPDQAEPAPKNVWPPSA